MDWYDRLKFFLKAFLLGALVSTLTIGFLYYRAVRSGYLELKKEQGQMALTIQTLKVREVEALNKAIREYQADLEELFKVPVYDIENQK